jgi:hypothetical protein
MADRSDDDFLARWSRRKRAAPTGAEPAQTAVRGAQRWQPPSAPSDALAAPETGPEAEGDPDVVAKLPDIDAMDDSSDFSVFLQNGVPEALRRRALRKLWRVNPVLANLDGLNNYDEDYTKLGMVEMPGLKTIYKVGRGFVLDDDEEAEAPTDSTAPVTSDAGTLASEGEQAAIKSPSDQHQKSVMNQPGNEISSSTPRTITEADGSADSNTAGKSKPSVSETAASKRLPGDALRRRWGGA